MVADAADSFLTFNTSPFSSPASSCDGGRVSSDDGRVSGDDGRVSGDDGQVSGDDGRVSGDGGRVSGDEGRVSGDDGRVSGDDGRVSGSIFPFCLLQGAWFEGGSTYPPLATKAQQSLKCEMVKR